MNNSDQTLQQLRIIELEELICNLREFVTFQEFTAWQNNMLQSIEDTLENNGKPTAY